MWRTNAGLVESHAWDSRPLDWPWLRRGINFWGKDHRQVYLIGNPIVWWTSTLALVIYAAVKGFSILRWQRGYKDYSNRTFPLTYTLGLYLCVATWRHYDWNVGVAVLGWGLHYLPFFLMKRQLFLHHYFPALYFAVIALCQEWDFLTTRSRFTSSPRRAPQLTLIFIVVVVAVFVSLSPLAYGGKWTKSSCEKARFFKTWDFDCPTFYDDVPIPLCFVTLLILVRIIQQETSFSSRSYNSSRKRWRITSRLPPPSTLPRLRRRRHHRSLLRRRRLYP